MASIHGNAYKITDNKGGVRIVVTQPNLIKNHITPSDTLVLEYKGVLHDPIDPTTVDYIASLTPEATTDVVVIAVDPSPIDVNPVTP